ncbi:MAG TPA: TIGR02996 domain-containing protein [Gemmataceae bacterium]|nr:TIGR02996 domain-containing protein [Gemmataceae bacterium]
MSESAFLAAICTNPSDDTPRLVFADWLEDHGQPVRAAFVRGQIELARTDEADPRYPALLARTRRCGVLTDASHRLECERGVTGAMFRRGFVAGVEGGGYAFPECEALPVEQLRLRGPEGDATGGLKALLKRPELSRLHTLALGERWPIEDITAIVRCPKLAGLRALAIDQPLAEDDFAFRNLVPRMKLPALDSLNLHFGAIPLLETEDAEWDERDPDWSGLLPRRPLRRLRLVAEEDTTGDWVWPGPDSDWLTASGSWPMLEVADVTLNANPISGTDFVAAMPPGGMFARLATSRLTRLTVNGSSLDRLLATPDWGNVRSLAVHDQFNAAQLARLFTSPQAQKLEHLTLCGDHIYSYREFEMGDLPDVVRTPGLLPKLRRLSLRSELAALANGSYRNHLLRLDVGAPGYLEEAWVEFLDLPLPQLRHLSLSRFRRPVELAPLFAAVSMPNLCTLQLGDYSHHTAAPTDAVWTDLARNPATPHLSLISAGTWQTAWLVVGDGEATPVADGTLPLDEDWWEPDPLARWFW